MKDVLDIPVAVAPKTESSAWRRWTTRPQSLWIRKAFFQVHLWVGIGVGLYIFVISISGSAIVFRRELTRKYSRKIITLAVSGPRLSEDEMTRRVQLAYPGYEIYNRATSGRADRPDMIVMGRGQMRISRLFNPYSGADLGDPVSRTSHALDWMIDLHDNLLGGVTGRAVNGIGSGLLSVLALTGIFIWWPGVQHWRRAANVSWRARLPRLNWDLHSAVGFWCSFFVLIWGISGIYLCFPDAFTLLVPNGFLAWITRFHFGRYNMTTKVLWTVLGLGPAVLFVTGALMWWYRVLRKKLPSFNA
jgi:uncharacterized iron-regulated membrane protein